MHPRTNTRKTNIYMSLATNDEDFLGRCDFSCHCAISILCSSQAIYSAQVNKIQVLVVFVQYRQLFNIFTFFPFTTCKTYNEFLFPAYSKQSRYEKIMIYLRIGFPKKRQIGNGKQHWTQHYKYIMLNAVTELSVSLVYQ